MVERASFVGRTKKTRQTKRRTPEADAYPLHLPVGRFAHSSRSVRGLVTRTYRRGNMCLYGYTKAIAIRARPGTLVASRSHTYQSEELLGDLTGSPKSTSTGKAAPVKAQASRALGPLAWSIGVSGPGWSPNSPFHALAFFIRVRITATIPSPEMARLM